VANAANQSNDVALKTHTRSASVPEATPREFRGHRFFIDGEARRQSFNDDTE
jgi:hypothetical protein